MASPTENAQILLDYWKSSGGKLRSRGMFEILTLVGKLATAREAMDELVTQAQVNPLVRTQVFAASHILSTGLFVEPLGYTDELLVVAKGNPLIGTEPLRLVMLKGILRAAEGGWFSAMDPSGLTMWMGSTSVTLAAFVNTIASDPNDEVRAVAIKIIASVAIPVFWVQRPALKPGQDPAVNPTQLERAIMALEAYLPGSPLDQPTRATLSGLITRAKERLGAAAFTVATAGLAAFPEFPTGDGKQAATVPPVPKPWYRNGQVVSAGLIALAGGAYYASRQTAAR
jgi:hypothetical protein